MTPATREIPEAVRKPLFNAKKLISHVKTEVGREIKINISNAIKKFTVIDS
jgi:ribosomal protein S5